MSNRSRLKEFGFEGLKVVERVAEKPSLEKYSPGKEWEKGIFCLRIDADEYEESSFNCYYPLFEEFKEAMTIFFNAYSFRDAACQVIKCKNLGLDIGSHGYYHYTYNDYANNRQNIVKAKDFFLKAGIEPKGFAAPFGKWNMPLSRALEDEGYGYSSEFAYDYMGFPNYPFFKGRHSRVIQIPIFPVAPELFYANSNVNGIAVKDFYFTAIDELIKCGLPVIIYAHTSLEYKDVPGLLKDIAEYAIVKKNLKPQNMTNIYERAKSNSADRSGNSSLIPSDIILGKDKKVPFFTKFKKFIKNVLDFERVTPQDELCCHRFTRACKILARFLTGVLKR